MKYNYTTDYSHPHYYSGKVFTSNRYGRYRILGKLLNHNRRGYYVVQFEETGHTTKAYCSAIKSGKRGWVRAARQNGDRFHGLSLNR